jgi:hypothetical protein
MLDARSGNIEVRGLKAGFAISNYPYVPEIDGSRDDRVEDWFSDAEQAVAEFLVRLDARDFGGIDRRTWTALVFGLVGLAHRGAHDMQLLRTAVDADPELRRGLHVGDGESHSVHHAVVENLINRITRDAQRLLYGSLTVVVDCEADVMVCDRPAIVRRLGNALTLLTPLGPNSLAVMDSTPGNAPMEIYSQVEHGMDATPLVSKLNGFTISRARRWVVGRTTAQLEGVRDDVLASAAGPPEKLAVEPVSELERQFLWSFGRDEEV